MSSPVEDNVPDRVEAVRLTKGIDMKDIMAGRGVEFEIDIDDLELEDSYQSKNNVFGNDEMGSLLKNCNPECLDLVEDDGYDDASPFEKLTSKMFNVTNDGKLKKRLIRAGNGETVPPNSRVTIHYNGYFEYHDEPFDSTYMRKRPFSFEVGVGANIIGLDKAVLTMKLNEKSQFLIHPDLGYGKHGCMERIPPNATLLFDIEVLKIILPGIAPNNEVMSESDKNNFKKIYMSCVGIQQHGKDLFARKCYKQAVCEYNKALGRLEGAVLEDMQDQEKQQELCIKLYTNIGICYNNLQKPQQACAACNNVLNLLRGSWNSVPVKILYIKGKALMMLSDFAESRRYLLKALKRKPNDKDISALLLKLQQYVKQQNERDVLIAKKMFGGGQNASNSKSIDGNACKVSKKFKEIIRVECENLVKDQDIVQYNMPGQLSKDEQEYLKLEASQHGLDFCRYNANGTDKFYICKRKSNDE